MQVGKSGGYGREGIFIQRLDLQDRVASPDFVWERFVKGEGLLMILKKNEHSKSRFASTHYRAWVELTVHVARRVYFGKIAVCVMAQQLFPG